MQEVKTTSYALYRLVSSVVWKRKKMYIYIKWPKCVHSYAIKKLESAVLQTSDSQKMFIYPVLKSVQGVAFHKKMTANCST